MSWGRRRFLRISNVLTLLAGLLSLVSMTSPVAAHAATSRPATVSHAAVVKSPASRQAPAKPALANATVSACSGAISPDTMYSCTSPSSTGTDTYSLTVSQVPNALMIEATAGNNVWVTTPDGNRISCGGYCQVTQAGTYSVAVTNYNENYTLEYSELLSESNCPTVDTSFSASATSGSLAAGQSGACYQLNMPSGDVLHSVVSFTSGTKGTDPRFYDATGAQVCTSGTQDCTLSGTAPYRVWMPGAGAAESYTMQLYDLTNPSGCQAMDPSTYGQIPAQGTDPCRAVTVTKADTYQVYAVGGSGGLTPWTLYNQVGTQACTSDGVGTCQLAAGTYDLVHDGTPGSEFGAAVLAVDESQGCTSTGDSGFSSGPATGTFTGVGEVECLTLPDTSGQSDYIFQQQPSPGDDLPAMQVVDATGAQQCATNGGTCALTGTAPFRVVLADYNDASLAYQLLVQNTATTSCPTWSETAYGSSTGASVTVASKNDIKCLTIPAGQHAAVERISAESTAGTPSVGVFDSSGKQLCTGICSYQSGVTYTALVDDSSAATVTVARRDMTQTANCGAPASTTLGGASTQFTLTSPLDAACYRITPAAADKLMAQISTMGPSHDLASGPDTATMMVTDASGAVICQNNCKLTGDTDYQLIVVPSGYVDVATRVSLNVWTLETASGLASQCTGNNQLTAADGWQVNGTLTDSDTAYCAEVKIRPSQKFGFFDVSTGQAASVAEPSAQIYVPDDWTGSGSLSGLCGGMTIGTDAQCDTSSSETSGTAIVVVDPGTAALGGFSMQGVCWSGGCTQTQPTPSISSISSASGAAGPNITVTVTGTALNLGDEIELTSSTGNGTHATARNLSVNAAGTSLTVSFDTRNLAVGKYDVGLLAPVVDESTGATGSLSGAYTITSAPSASLSGFTSVTQTQIASESLAKGSTTVVGVGGKGGVPSSGATSAKLEITVTNPSTAGSITVYPGSESKPNTTALNFAAGQTQTDMVDVQLGSGVELYNGAGGSLNVTVDTVGYYSSGGSEYNPLSQARILNSTSVASKTTKEINVGGNGGVPSSGASSVVLEVTESGSAAAGSAVVYPNGGTRPADADLSFAKGQTVTDQAIGKLGTGLLVYNNSSGAVNFTVDVIGYYSSSGSKFHSLNPTRILDTRSDIGGNGDQGIPSQAAAVTKAWNANGVPRDATAVVVDVTALSPQDAGTLTAYADCDGSPFGQSLAFAAGSGQKATDQVVIPLYDSPQQPSGDIDIYNDSGGTVQIVGDIEGYYA